MQIICCNRCHKKISIPAKSKITLPAYRIMWIGPGSNTFDLCCDCQKEFETWVKKWLNEKKMTYEDFIKNLIDDKEKMKLIRSLIIYSYVFQ